MFMFSGLNCHENFSHEIYLDEICEVLYENLEANLFPGQASINWILFVKFLFKDRICRNRPESASSTGTGPRQRPPQEQLQGNDHWKSRPKPETYAGPGPSKAPLWEQSQVRDICVNRPKAASSPEAVTSSEIGTNDWPLRKKALARDLWTGRQTAAFKGASLSQWLLIEQAQITSRITETTDAIPDYCNQQNFWSP